MEHSHKTAAEQKHALIATRVKSLREEVGESLAALSTSVERPTADPHEQYAAVVHEIAKITQVCEMTRDLIVAAAVQEPNPMPLGRLSEAAGVAKNTLRARMPQVRQGRPYDQPPF